MKKSILLGATFAFLGLAVVPTFAQTQSTTTTSSSGYIESSKIIGTTVKSAQGEEIGTIKDVVLDRSTGCMAYTVLSTGGTTSRLTGSAKTVAVPWTVYATSSDPRVMTVRLEKEKIYNAPVFEYSRIQEYSSSGWINNVNTYYGVSAGVSTGVGVNYQSTTNTGATATTSTASQTNATTSASPAASASPMATATPAMSASPSTSVSPAASTSASASAGTSATASPGASASAKEATGKGHRRPVSPQHHGEEMMGTKEKAGEKSSTDTTGEAATTSSGSSKSSASESASPSKKGTHHRAGQSSSPGAESSATPKSSDEPQQ